MKPRHITTIIDGDTYVFRFRPERIDEVADKLYEFVHNPELNMDWQHADRIYALHIQPIIEAQARLDVWDLARGAMFGMGWMGVILGPWWMILKVVRVL